MNKEQTFEFIVAKYAEYIEMRKIDYVHVSNFCNQVRLELLDNICYVMGSALKIKDAIIDKYDPNSFVLVDYFEHIFHKNFINLLLAVSEKKYDKGSYIFYGMVFITLLKRKMNIQLEKMYENDPEFISKHPDVINLNNERKKENIEIIIKIRDVLLRIDPASQELTEINLLLKSNNIQI